MERAQALKEIEQIFRDVLDLENLHITEATKAEDIEEWDSLTHIQLIVAIEKHFKLKFTSKEISEWKDVGEMINNIQSKLGGEKKNASPDPVKGLKHEGKDDVPTYKINHIKSFPSLVHGENCFVGEGASLKNVILGDRVWINKHATIFSNYDYVKFGSDCYVGPYVWIEGHAGIEFGNSVHIAGPGTNLHTHSGMKMALNGQHLGNPGYRPVLEKDHYYRVPIRIGNNVWIGPNCSISPGVIIKDFVVVMPNSIVKSGIIESYSLVSGDGVIETNSEFVRSLIEKN